MNAVANHMEKKYHYEAKGKINPYRVSAIGIASGRMKTTGDLMRTGAYLGAKGSFNVTTDPPGLDPNTYPRESDVIVSDDPLLNAISDTVNDNRYAWRLNCESGWEYGIDPEDYETREEYNLALSMVKQNEEIEQVDEAVIEDDEEDMDRYTAENVWKHVHCSISRLDNGKTEAFWIDNPDVKVGDVVDVITEAGPVQGVVVLVENE